MATDPAAAPAPSRHDDAHARTHPRLTALFGAVRDVYARVTPNRPSSTDLATDRFVDAAGRRISFQPYRPDRYASLVAMYDDFAPAHRAQGLPPAGEPAIESWLDVVLDERSVLATHDGDVVGHAMFVAGDDHGHELGIFVHQDYHDAGVGTHLLAYGLEHARRQGVADVWLSVERSNRRACKVYRRLGFRDDLSSGCTFRMTRSL